MSQVITHHEPAYQEGMRTSTKANNPDLPSKWDGALYKVQRGLMGSEWTQRMMAWLKTNSYQMQEGGDGTHRRNWEIGDVCDQSAPAAELSDKLMSQAKAAMGKCQVNEFELDWLEMHVLVHHDRDVFQWHTDHFESSNVHCDETRTLTFCYYLRPNLGTFVGGELEFWDGTRIEHVHDQCVWLHPYQVHRIRRVRSMSDKFLDGRISLIGWIHCKKGEEANNDH